MKDCVRFAPMLEAREGELSHDEAAALVAHLDGCPRCRALRADFAATAGLVADGLMARANARDFAPFVDAVMARVAAQTERDQPVRAERQLPVRAERSGRAAAAESRHVPAAAESRHGPGLLGWIARYRRLVLAAAVPVVAAAAVLMYVRQDGGRRQVAQLEMSTEGEVTTVLETSDGPVVLLGEERS